MVGGDAGSKKSHFIRYSDTFTFLGCSFLICLYWFLKLLQADWRRKLKQVVRRWQTNNSTRSQSCTVTVSLWASGSGLRWSQQIWHSVLQRPVSFSVVNMWLILTNSRCTLDVQWPSELKVITYLLSVNQATKGKFLSCPLYFIHLFSV